MPDAAVPEVQFKAAEVLHYGGETTVSNLSLDMQTAKDKGILLRQEEVKAGGGKPAFEIYVNKTGERKFTKQHRENLDSEFGALEATKNATTGKFEMPATATPEAKALYDEKQAELENIYSFIQYSEITAEAKRTGKSIDVVLGERTRNGIEGPKSQTEFDAQKEKTLDCTLDAEAIRKGIPEMVSITDIADRRKLVEETLAADPALRGKILEKTISVAERVKNLPKPPMNKEVKDAEDNKKEAGVKITENLDFIKNKLKELGFDDGKADSLDKDVEKYIKDGKSLDQTLTYLRSESIGQIKNISAIQRYINASSQIENLEKALRELDSRNSAHKPLIIDAEARYARAKSIIAEFQANEVLVGELGVYQNIVRAFTNQRDNSSSAVDGGILLSPVASGIEQIIKAQKDIVNADKTIKEKGGLSKQEQEAWRVDRLIQESNLISEMQNIIPSSVAEVLKERCDKMTGLEKQRMLRIIEEEKKMGKEAVAKGLKNVEDEKTKRWIYLNESTRKEEISTHNIAEDIIYLSYGKEDANMRLIYRASGLELTDAGGTVLKDADGNPVTYKTLDFSKLPEDRRKVFEEIYQAQKDSYKQKLFRDFFLAKNVFNRRLFGKQLGQLALKKHELVSLQGVFGESFAKNVNAKAEVKAVAETLKAKGVKLNGGLLAMLALLLAAPVSGMKKAFEG